MILEINTEKGPRVLIEGANLSIATLFILLYKKDSIEYMYIAAFTSALSKSRVFGMLSRFLMPAMSKKVYQSSSILEWSTVFVFPSSL